MLLLNLPKLVVNNISSRSDRKRDCGDKQEEDLLFLVEHGVDFYSILSARL